MTQAEKLEAQRRRMVVARVFASGIAAAATPPPPPVRGPPRPTVIAGIEQLPVLVATFAARLVAQVTAASPPGGGRSIRLVSQRLHVWFGDAAAAAAAYYWCGKALFAPEARLLFPYFLPADATTDTDTDTDMPAAAAAASNGGGNSGNAGTSFGPLAATAPRFVAEAPLLGCGRAQQVAAFAFRCCSSSGGSGGGSGSGSGSQDLL